MRAHTTLSVASWQEETFSELEGGGTLVHARVGRRYRGDLEGEGTLQYLMRYRCDGQTTFHGLERFVGRLDGRAGSFVFEHEGSFVGGVVNEHSRILPHSGTGDLKGISGGTRLASAHQAEYALVLEYEFEGKDEG